MGIRNHSLRKKRLELDNFSCVFCYDNQDVQVHHIIPRTRGGKEELTNMLSLCNFCHRLIHLFNPKVQYLHSQLTKEALAKVKANGKKLGRPFGWRKVTNTPTNKNNFLS